MKKNLLQNKIPLILNNYLAAVLTTFMGSHKDTSTARLARALTSEAGDLSIGINVVVLKNGQLDLLLLVLDPERLR